MTRHSIFFCIFVMCGCVFGTFAVTSNTYSFSQTKSQLSDTGSKQSLSSDAHSAVAEALTWSVQRALVERNYYLGPVDGLAGDETAEALFWFQIEHDLQPTGSISAEVLKKLNIQPPSWFSK